VSKKDLSPKQLKTIVNLLFEVGMLAKTPRGGFYFLGSGTQSVAEHIHRTTHIGYVLAQMAADVDEAKILEMCLFHDLPEARTSDLNYVHQKYVVSNESKAINDLTGRLFFGGKIKNILAEYAVRKSKESLLAKDADQLELLLSLCEESDTGNTRAVSWVPSCVKRLKTEQAKTLAKVILKTASDEWWFENRDGDWWVNRNGK
jgi:putative hydrolase of HD superfamily